MPGYEYGGSLAVKTPGDGVTRTISEFPPTGIIVGAQGILDKASFEAKFVLVRADSSNTGTVYVGPNGSAAAPLVGGDQIPVWYTDPSKIAINDKGSSGQLIYVIWGAASERWFALQAKLRALEEARRREAEKLGNQGEIAAATAGLSKA